MSYTPGTHPHIRASESVRSLTWAAVFSLLPALAGYLILVPARVLHLLIFLLAAVVYEEMAAIFFKDLPLKKYRNFKNGTVFLYLLIFLMMLPPAAPVFAGAAGFIFALFFAYGIFGGQGACTFHPVLCGLLFLRILFQNKIAFQSPDFSVSLFFWAMPAALAVGGVSLFFRKALRMQVAIFFLAILFLMAWFDQTALNPWKVMIWLLTGCFVITDLATTPLRFSSHLLFALICAALTASLEYGGLDSLTACVLAVLTGNALTPWLDAMIFSRPAGVRHG